jgi:hypothetical protein
MAGPGDVVAGAGAPSAVPMGAEADPRTGKLDRVATTLIGAVAAVGGLLAVFGVNSDRVNLLLDDEKARNLLIVSGISAVVAICLSLLALLVGRASLEVSLLAAGAGAYVAGLMCAIFAAAGAADYAGRPSITDVGVQPGTPVSLSMTVRGANLDEDQGIGVQVTDEHTGGVLYSATMRPDGSGRVEQQVALPVPGDAQDLLLRAWRTDTTQPPPSCESGTAYVVCADLTMPAVVGPPGT